MPKLTVSNPHNIEPLLKLRQKLKDALELSAKIDRLDNIKKWWFNFKQNRRSASIKNERRLPIFIKSMKSLKFL